MTASGMVVPFRSLQIPQIGLARFTAGRAVHAEVRDQI